MTHNEDYIYESPDDGLTVYRRKHKGPRELIHSYVDGDLNDVIIYAVAMPELKDIIAVSKNRQTELFDNLIKDIPANQLGIDLIQIISKR